MGTKVTLDMRDRQRLEVVASLDAGRARAAQLLQEKCAAYNTHHLAERLAQAEGITLSVSILRRIRLAVGRPSPRKRRPPKERKPRERRPQGHEGLS
jgi:hypothetical protein